MVAGCHPVLPVEMGVVDSRWCYLQNGTLLDQNKVPLPDIPGFGRFSSPEGTLVVNRDWRCSWHSMKSGRSGKFVTPFLASADQGVSNAAQFPTQGTADS